MYFPVSNKSRSMQNAREELAADMRRGVRTINRIKYRPSYTTFSTRSLALSLFLFLLQVFRTLSHLYCGHSSYAEQNRYRYTTWKQCPADIKTSSVNPLTHNDVDNQNKRAHTYSGVYPVTDELSANTFCVL